MVTLTTPFHFGEVGGTLRYATFEAVTETVPDFNALQGTVAWRYPLRLGPVSFTPGIQAGLLATTFDDDLTRYAKTESELLLGLSGRVEVGTPWHFFAEATAEHIFYAESVTTVWLFFGTGYRFPTPHWLRAFLE